MIAKQRLGARIGAGLWLALAVLATPACGDDDPFPPGYYYCRTNSDCPPGYDCCTRDDCRGACLVHCDEDSDCIGGRCQHHMCY